MDTKEKKTGNNDYRVDFQTIIERNAIELTIGLRIVMAICNHTADYIKIFHGGSLSQSRILIG